MSDSDNTGAICPCGAFVHPAVIFNPPGRNAIAYRPGDYTTFRHALLQALEGETQLTQRDGGKLTQIWRPSAEGDLAMQMVEWWAYLAEVFTFYSERVANQAYLRTADLPESVNRLIQVLGYRPRPGIGATGILAGLVNSPKSFTLPKGFQIQSKPGPGNQPQVFELSADTTIQTPDSVSAQLQSLQSSNQPLISSGQVSNQIQVWLKGTIGGIKSNDKLLLLKNQSSPPDPTTSYAWLTVQSIQAQADPNGKAVTQVTFSPVINQLETNPQLSDYQLLKNGQSARPWSYPVNTTSVIQTGSTSGIDLAGIARQISVEDPVLLEVLGSPSDSLVATQLVTVNDYSEQVWYANGDGPTFPSSGSSPPPPDTSLIAIPITHTHLGVLQSLLGNWNANTALVTVRYAWTAVGQLVPVLTAQDYVYSGGAGPLSTTAAAALPNGETVPVLLEDPDGDGAQADATVNSSGTTTTFTLSKVTALPQAGLMSPLNVLFNLLPVSCGKTVANEVLGSGNAALPAQDFTLQKAPVTYLQDSASNSGDDYSSTVQVSVNGLQWKEVPSFYGQGPGAEVFVTREDEAGNTHVTFGDGSKGSRLPTGVNNVIATYRYGSGAGAPPAGTLTVILQPQPGLQSIRNPVAVGGGADPYQPGQIKTYAPRSVLTFGRAVSLDDYEAIAASAPGVQRATAAFAFDAASQRPSVTVWVGDDAGAVSAATKAIAAAADPNRAVIIKQATSVDVVLSLTIVRDPRRDDQTVKTAVQAALLDADSGLFGVNVVGIGEAFYESQIYAACVAVPGVEAVHNLSFSPVSLAKVTVATPLRLTLAVAVARAVRSGTSGAAVSMASQTGIPSVCSSQRHDPGQGAFYFIPDDGQHLNLSSVVGT